MIKLTLQSPPDCDDTVANVFEQPHPRLVSSNVPGPRQSRTLTAEVLLPATLAGGYGQVRDRHRYRDRSRDRHRFLAARLCYYFPPGADSNCDGDPDSGQRSDLCRYRDQGAPKYRNI